MALLARLLHSFDVALRGSPLRAVVRATGLGRLGRAMYHRSVLRTGVHARSYFGQTLRFVVSSPREVSMIDGDYAEDDFIVRLLDCVRPGDAVFDVGANIGTVGLLIAAKNRERDVTVHAFEPEPRNAEHLRRNAALNDLSNVTVHELALGDAAGSMKLFLSGPVGAGEHSLVASHRDTGSAIEVRVARGDDFCAGEAPCPDVMKIDVEGAEIQVLAGFDRLLHEGRIRELLIEVHVGTIEKQGWSPARLQAWLHERGYEKVWTTGRKTELHEHYRRRATS